MYRYIGNGEFIPGVPARDLTDAEAERYGVEDAAIYVKEQPPEPRGNERRKPRDEN